jgi:hypothetical protein
MKAPFERFVVLIEETGIRINIDVSALFDQKITFQHLQIWVQAGTIGALHTVIRPEHLNSRRTTA